MRIAHVFLRNDEYYIPFDGKQPKEYADALKKKWLDRFIEGRADNDTH